MLTGFNEAPIGAPQTQEAVGAGALISFVEGAQKAVSRREVHILANESESLISISTLYLVIRYGVGTPAILSINSDGKGKNALRGLGYTEISTTTFAKQSVGRYAQSNFLTEISLSTSPETWGKVLASPKGEATSVFSTFGVSIKGVLGSGESVTELHPFGYATPATLGTGQAQYTLTTEGVSVIAELGVVSAELSVWARQGILRPPEIPSAYRAAHSERHLYVPKDKRTF